MSPRAIAGLCVVALIACGASCERRRKPDTGPPPRPPELAAPPVALRAPRATPRPRILLDEAARTRLREAARRGTPTWRLVEHDCQGFLERDEPAGYMASEWHRAIMGLTLCWYATGQPRYRDRAVVYVGALVKDKARIGDGQGGAELVAADSGYPIRYLGVTSALAYDWLYDAPGMAELRPLIVQRLEEWLGWYQEHGYLNDSPYSNYFWGYLSSLVLAGIALDGDAPPAPGWLTEARRLLDDVVVPSFYRDLAGGEWAEGWQYGQGVAASVALSVEALYTATGADLAPQLPWLAEVVDDFQHRIVPGRDATYGNATQEVRPAPADAFALASVLVVLRRSDPAAAARARFLIERVYPPIKRHRAWMPLLTDEPDAPRTDPRRDDARTFHMRGPGRTFTRSSWKDDAVFLGFQAGHRIAVDHQHADQGHLEIWRGSDPLLADLGIDQAFATINHNTLLIDDPGLRFSPNQGLWNRVGSTLGWSDDGAAVVMVGSFADAWDPKCVVEQGCDEHPVVEARRTVVYLRPGAIAVEDRVQLVRAASGVRWAGHLRAAPTVAGARIAATVGASQLAITALEPAAPPVAVVKEQKQTEGHLYTQLLPAGDVWRVELDTPRGDARRRIVTWLDAAAAGQALEPPTRLEGTGLLGGVGRTDGARVAVLFADAPAGGEVALPAGVARVVIAGLGKGEGYAVRLKAEGAGCALTVAPGQGPVADAAGALSLALDGCAAR